MDTVIFWKSEKGGVITRYQGYIAFPEHNGMQPKEGEEWKVVSSRSNPPKNNVLFLTLGKAPVKNDFEPFTEEVTLEKGGPLDYYKGIRIDFDSGRQIDKRIPGIFPCSVCFSNDAESSLQEFEPGTYNAKFYVSKIQDKYICKKIEIIELVSSQEDNERKKYNGMTYEEALKQCRRIFFEIRPHGEFYPAALVDGHPLLGISDKNEFIRIIEEIEKREIEKRKNNTDTGDDRDRDDHFILDKYHGIGQYLS